MQTKDPDQRDTPKTHTIKSHRKYTPKEQTPSKDTLQRRTPNDTNYFAQITLANCNNRKKRKTRTKFNV